MPQPGSAPKVLFIVGAGRSGSTILGNILGEFEGFVHVGELLDSWSLLAKDRLCGCGENLGRCPFWSGLMAEVFDHADYEGVTPEQVRRWREQCVRYRHVPRLLRGSRASAADSDAQLRYRRLLDDLYRVIARRTGARVIVDTSKSGPDAVLLGTLQGIRPYFVHLVRDPRAVSYSWLRLRRIRGDAAPPVLKRWTPARVGRNWLLVQGLIEAIRLRDRSHAWLTLRYEDFASAPKKSLDWILETIEEPRAEGPFLDDYTVMLGANHTAGGNRSRFAQGAVRIRRDDEWMTEQRRQHRFVLTLLTGLLLPRYRYPLRVATLTGRAEPNGGHRSNEIA